ncbi:MAG: GAF domain-containing protein [Anaerolineae bacterium]|nr:GAF domain-containing protein [Anaerolineae bacterium]
MVTNTLGVLQRENARLQSENHALQKELSTLRNFVENLNTLVERVQDADDSALMPLLHNLFTWALELVQAPEGSLLLLDEETHELKFILVQGALAERLQGYRIPADEGIAGWVVQNARPTLVRDVRRDERFSETIDDTFKFRTQSIVAVPLIGGGRVLGVLEALNQPSDEPFSDTDVILLNLLCRFAGELLLNIAQQS